MNDKTINELQIEFNIYSTQDKLTYQYFKEMEEIRKKDKEEMKKWYEEERILRAETMFQLPEGKYYIKNGTIMYKLSSGNIISKTSVN